MIRKRSDKMQEYRLKFYLNAMHSIILNEEKGQLHPHTWEICLDITSNDNFVMFSKIESGIEQLLSTYQNKILNDIEPFNKINPTLENITFYFKDIIYKFLLANGWILNRLEVSETPSRSFIVNIPELNKAEALPSFEFDQVQNIIDAQTLTAVKEKITNLSQLKEDTIVPPGERTQEPPEELPSELTEELQGSDFKNVYNFINQERQKIRANRRKFIFILTGIFIVALILLTIKFLI